MIMILVFNMKNILILCFQFKSLNFEKNNKNWLILLENCHEKPDHKFRSYKQLLINGSSRPF